MENTAQEQKEIYANFIRTKMDLKEKEGLVISRFEVDEILAEMTGEIKAN